MIDDEMSDLLVVFQRPCREAGRRGFRVTGSGGGGVVGCGSGGRGDAKDFFKPCDHLGFLGDFEGTLRVGYLVF